MSEETTPETPRRRGRPRGSKNGEATTAAAAAPTKRGRRKKTGDFDPSTLTFEQVIATVKYAQDKIGDIAPILQQQ